MPENNIYLHLAKILFALMEIDMGEEELIMEEIMPMFNGLMRSKNLKFMDECWDEIQERHIFGKDVRLYFYESINHKAVTVDEIRRMLYELSEPILIKITK